ncbi:hypothetical protein BFW01_g550 [Lasiodiplodia theobromae]|nr:hypothetical protein BFW01_g550 [Lasiodiplodia theobromae]
MANQDNQFFAEEAARTFGVSPSYFRGYQVEPEQQEQPFQWGNAVGDPDPTLTPMPAVSGHSTAWTAPVEGVNNNVLLSPFQPQRYRRVSSELSSIAVAMPSQTSFTGLSGPSATTAANTTSEPHTFALQRTTEEQASYNDLLGEESLRQPSWGRTLASSNEAQSNMATPFGLPAMNWSPQFFPPSTIPSPEMFTNTFPTLETTAPGNIFPAQSPTDDDEAGHDGTNLDEADHEEANYDGTNYEDATDDEPSHDEPITVPLKHKQPPTNPPPYRSFKKPKIVAPPEPQVERNSGMTFASPADQSKTKSRHRRASVSYSGGSPTEADRRTMNSLRCNRTPLTALLRRYAVLIITYPQHPARRTVALRNERLAESSTLSAYPTAADALSQKISRQMAVFGALDEERRMVRRQRAGVDGALDREMFVRKALSHGWIEIIGRERIEGYDKGIGRMDEEVVLRGSKENEEGEVGIDFFTVGKGKQMVESVEEDDTDTEDEDTDDDDDGGAEQEQGAEEDADGEEDDEVPEEGDQAVEATQPKNEQEEYESEESSSEWSDYN